MNADESSKELTREELAAIARDQRDRIARLKDMLWVASGMDDTPPVTEEDFQEALKTAPNQRITHLLAELEARLGSEEGEERCSA